MEDDIELSSTVLDINKDITKNTSNASEVPAFFEEIKQEEQLKINKKKSRLRLKKKKKSEKPEKSALLDEHTLKILEVAQRYGTEIDLKEPKNSKGLTTADAKSKLEKDGPNMLTQGKVTPVWLKFLKEFLGFFPLLLEGAGILCFIGYGLQPDNADNLYLGVILWIVVIVTAIFSFMQDSKSSKVMEGFKKLAPQYCKVHRDGKLYEINASELVVGDLVEIKAGDKIPADLLLFWVNELKVDNSSLTGESEPQSRSTECTDANPLETHNLAFFGTLANEGEGVGMVIRTGDRTVIGTIANLASTTKNEDTPLKHEISRFIKIVSVVAISLGIIFFIVGYFVDLDWIPNVVFAIGIIVANVPEGLLPTVTVALTLTAKRLASKNVLVKNLEAVETLGSCSTIASDKTGTLTQNRMTVVHLYYDNKIWTCDDIANAGVFDRSSPSFVNLHRIAALCNRAVFDSDPDNMNKEILLRKTVGDASESALLKFCEPIENVEKFRGRYPKVFEIPFNSVNKWQLSIHETMEKESLLLMKGAPERVIERCDKIFIDGEVVPMTPTHEKHFLEAYETLAGKGERVLGFAQLPLDTPPSFPYNPDLHNFPTKGLIFVGLMALMDPPRTTVPEAVAKCKQAGVRVIMVTGDHPLTAVAIARQVGIIEGRTVEDIAKLQNIPLEEVDFEEADAVVIKGSELDALHSHDWDRILKKRQIVFARTSPEQKLQIVEQCQKRGEIVAVTGDGVNDSPALKKADLGCAMGITGSDVSKEAADVILLDDNFASIVAGIEEGRIIFDNLKKSICYTLSSNTTELLPFLLFVIARMPLALSAVLILCIDLGTDMVPAISLAYEKPESDIMSRKPRNPKKDRLVTPTLAVFSYIYLSIWQTLAGIIAYLTVFSDYGISPSQVTGISFNYFKRGASEFMGYSDSQQLEILSEAQTAFFVAVVLTRIGCLFVSKTKKLSIFPNLFKNNVTDIGVFIEIALMVLLVYVPGVTTVFGTRGVGWKPWVIGIPFSLGLVAAEEIRKIWIRKYPTGYVKKFTYW